MFERLLSRLSAALDRRSIPYMVIGGQAVLLYGELRLTRDIDIAVGMGTEGVERMLEVVEDLSLGLLPEDPRTFARETMVLPAVEGETG